MITNIVVPLKPKKLACKEKSQMFKSVHMHFHSFLGRNICFFTLDKQYLCYTHTYVYVRIYEILLEHIVT